MVLTLIKGSTLDILKDVGLLGAKSATTPLLKGHKFTSNNSLLLNDLDRYRRL